MTDLWDYADHLHDESKADRCQCGGEARYWLPGDVYVCLTCYQAVQASMSVVHLCKECGTEVDGQDGVCPHCNGRE